LLVEDEPHLAEMVRVGLVSEGFVVEVCGDGDEGLRIGTVGDFDVIVLDIMLPKVNGYDVLRGLRERGVWTPVLMLTAKDGEFDQADAFDLGADDYLTKPFSFVVFVARLRALQRRGAPERPVVFVAGDLVVDPARRRVCRGDTPNTVPTTTRPPPASASRPRPGPPPQRLGPAHPFGPTASVTGARP